MGYLETIDENREKFRRYNDLKYQRFQQLLPNPNMKRVLNAIPFLLSINNKRLPGYVEGDVPLGIYGYFPDDETKRFLHTKYPAVRIEPVVGTHYVEMLAVMGSVGTVAYNKKSDFDYWVCVNRDSVTREQFGLFEKKVESIQKWAESEIEVPVHLFINDIQSIKMNIFAEDEEEAFGTTVGAVLKDEFLRSSIIIAGKIPFWWSLPHLIRDNEYDTLIEKLPDTKRQYFLDLGNLFEISREDFLGAALFQIIKSLGNPFKSIIKIGVLEKYIFGKGDSPLLSQKIKINVQRGNLDNSIVDSYLLMFNEVFDYYSTTLKDKDMIDILKKNLYLKVDPQISKYIGIKDRKNIPYKVAVMFKYAKDWGWDVKTLRDLDNFDQWDFNKIMNFWDSVKRFMLLSYQKIATQLPSLKLEKKISETDFMLLSRKIKTHFSREKDKIDNFITFKDTPSEAILYIEPVSQGIHDMEWRLFKRNKSEDDTFVSTTLRVEKELLHLITWVAVNQIYEPVFSRLHIQSGYSRINQNFVVELLGQITTLFSANNIKIKNQYFLEPAFALVNVVIINFNIENNETIQTLHHLYYSSWGESYIKEYKAEEDIARILHLVIRDGIKLKARYDNYCVVNCPEPHKKFYKYYQVLFKEAYSSLIEATRHDNVRFVTRLGSNILMITRNGNDVTANLYSSYIKFIAAIGLKPLVAVRYHIFSDEEPLLSMQHAYSMYRDNSVVAVYEEKNEQLIIYVVNESGNMFVFVKSRKNRDQVLMSLFDFCKNVIKRVNEKHTLSLIEESRIGFFKIERDRMGNYHISDETEKIQAQYLTSFKTNSAVAVAVSKSIGPEPFYDVQFPDNITSGLMTINEVYSIKDKVNELRIKGYPLSPLVRDLYFNDLKDEEYSRGTSLFFLEKSKLEFVISRVAAP